MDIRQIKQIVEVCRLGSIGRAAHQLGISQSALSRSLSRIEDRLGVRLFERTGEGAKPTAYATYIAEHAQPALQRVAALSSEVKLLSKGEIGRLSIGVGPTVRALFFPELLTMMTRRFPKLTIKTFQDTEPGLMRMVQARQLDVALTTRTLLKEETPFLVTSLCRDEVDFFVRPEHPILESAPLNRHLLRLLQHPIVTVGVSPGLRGMFPVTLDRELRRNLAAYQVSDFTLVKEMIIATDAIGYAPQSVFSDDVADGRMRRLNVNRSVFECVAVALRESRHLPIVNEFVLAATELIERRATNTGSLVSTYSDPGDTNRTAFLNISNPHALVSGPRSRSADPPKAASIRGRKQGSAATARATPQSA